MLAVQTIIATFVVCGVYGNVIREGSKVELRLKREPGTEHASEICGLKPSEKVKLEKDAKEHKLDTHPDEETTGLFEGDIELDERQKKLLDEMDGTRDQIADEREVPDKFVQFWPTGQIPIPIEIDPAFDEDQTAKIKESIDHIKQYTNCVVFKKRESKDDSYIKFKKTTEPICKSGLGQKMFSPTVISLHDICFKDGPRRVIVHEMMHAFGFLHEHSRMDRDEYVDIIESNIKPKERREFWKGTKIFKNLGYRGRVFGETYDFGSIMHYGLKAFAIDKSKYTIKPKPEYEDEAVKIVGQRTGLSDKDVRKIDKLFECPRRRQVSSCHEFKTTRENSWFWVNW